MKILVCGSRSFWDWGLLSHILNKHVTTEDRIIIGGARGADAQAEKWAQLSHVAYQVFPADWKRFGRPAGYIRNAKMIQEHPNLVIAFWDGVSKGTLHTIRLAKKAGIKTVVVEFESSSAAEGG